MRILLASSEVHPYSKTGGLADAVGALGKHLAKAGHQVGIVTPFYRGIAERFGDIRREDWWFDLPMGNARADAELYSHKPLKGLTVYLIRKPEYFDRSGIYSENGIDYADNAERFIFFSKCVCHLATYLPWKPEILHVNDWQTALVPAMVDHQRSQGWINPPPVCLTIHNLAYQGVFPASAFSLTNLPPEYFQAEGAEHFGMLNCLKAGIVFADLLTTVSPRYAREITTEEFGCGLDGVLRKRQDRLFGILNGVDYDEWKTTNNPFLNHSYSVHRLAGKKLLKQELQRTFSLPPKADTPLFGTVTRLVDQKGVDITLGALEEMLQTDMQFVLLGSGDPAYERAFKNLATRFPDKASVKIGFDQALSHQVEAGCDFYMMPSKFEPCGLNQLYSLRYGTIPIVRTTGGLDDTIIDARQDAEHANGIKFESYSSVALAKAMRKALVIYKSSEVVRHYQRNGMCADFSWERTVKDYVNAYLRMLND